MSRRRLLENVDGRLRGRWEDGPGIAPAPLFAPANPPGPIERRRATPEELAAIRARDEEAQRRRIQVAFTKPIEVAKAGRNHVPLAERSAASRTRRAERMAGPSRPNPLPPMAQTTRPSTTPAAGGGGPRVHLWGCICRSHVDRPWDRSEHWTVAEVEYLDRTYGRQPDGAIARRLRRTVLGVRLKAKRLGLHKRTQGLTARAFAQIFGVDSGTVSKVWIRRGLLPARCVETRELDGRATYWLIDHAAAERFIHEHPEWVDVEKMPDSWYRELAARDPWISLPEVHRRTGRNQHVVGCLIRAGEIRGRRRGTHWFIPASEIPRIRPLRSPEAIDESVFRRGSRLEMRRNRRKGVARRPAQQALSA